MSWKVLLDCSVVSPPARAVTSGPPESPLENISEQLLKIFCYLAGVSTPTINIGAEHLVSDGAAGVAEVLSAVLVGQNHHLHLLQGGGGGAPRGGCTPACRPDWSTQGSR